MQIKVLHIFNSLRFSGAEIMYTSAASLFQQKGCKLYALATTQELGDFAPMFQKAGFDIMHLPIPPLNKLFKRLLFYKKLINLLKKEKINIVHIHSHAAMWNFALCSRFAKVRSIYTFHNVFTSRPIMYPYHFLKRWSAKKVFKCTFQTISETVYLHELNFFHNKTIKVYNWYDKKKFFPASLNEKLETRKSLKISEDAFVLISIGGCSSIKRHSDIIQALPTILQIIPQCIYLHLGSGETENDEKKLAEKLGILDKVHFLGNQSNIRSYLVASDVYLITSKFEGISITTIEAMACRIPSVLYNVPGLKDFNIHEENSILIEPDFNLIPDQIVHMMNDSKSKQEMILRAEKFVNQNNDMSKNVEKIFDLYLKNSSYTYD